MSGAWLAAPLLMLAAHGVPVLAPPAATVHRLTRRDLRRFAGRIFARDMKAFHVPGAVFVVVRDGKVLYAHGYGDANLARRTPVEPDRTIFRLAPVSAVFTSAAVLRLAADGRVNLHANVNRYLAGFKLANNYPQPVTLADLLTNTGGFDDRHIGRRTLNPSSVQPLGSFLAATMPPRVNPPGRVYSYSTFGFTLAGYVVQTVSKMPFAEYVDSRIFRPLGMRRSSFQQPPPARSARDLATGYDVGSDGVPHAAPEEYFNVAPGAGMIATASDVAHFISALLLGGKYRGRRVLPRAMVGDMERQKFTSYPHPGGYPPLPGVTDGFGRYFQNGQLLVEHSGSVRGFTSLLALLPKAQLGFFIAGNAARDPFPFDLQRRLLDRYYPTARQKPHPPYAGGSLAPFTGTYWLDGYSLGSIEKLRQLVNQVHVTASGRDTLLVHFGGAGTSRVTRVAPLLFQHVTGHTVTYWAFQADSRGHIIRMTPGGITEYDKVPWYDATDIQTGLAVVILLVLLAAVVLWVTVPSLRRGPSLVGGLVVVTSALDLLFVIAIGLAMWSAVSTETEHYSWLEYGAPAWVYVLLSVPLVALVLTAILVITCIGAWWKGSWPVARGVYHTAVAFDAVAFVLFLQFWNLLGFRF